MSNIATGSNAMVQITVNAWSTAEERERLITTVLEKGPDALLRELQKTPDKGRFRIPTARQPDPHQLALGLDLHYAWQTPLKTADAASCWPRTAISDSRRRATSRAPSTTRSR